PPPRQPRSGVPSARSCAANARSRPPAESSSSGPIEIVSRNSAAVYTRSPPTADLQLSSSRGPSSARSHIGVPPASRRPTTAPTPWGVTVAVPTLVIPDAVPHHANPPPGRPARLSIRPVPDEASWTSASWAPAGEYTAMNPSLPPAEV